MSGVKEGQVTLVPYDSRWPREFAVERKRLEDKLGSAVITIEHIGSTAVQGLCAKPIIDINVAIYSLEDASELIKPLQELGYEHAPNQWFTDRFFFSKGTKHATTRHLNIVEITSETAWEAPILFRDYLAVHPEAKDAYATLKTELAAKYANDRTQYTEAKSRFVLDILAKAKQETHENRP
jgi:GrpB-like predicted nucleotidyltransferase (UPF0157 family)